MCKLLASVAALVLLTFAPAARADECPGAPALWKRGPAEAERVARRCQQEAPRDADRFLALAQVLAWSEKYAEALAWLELGLSHHPDAADLHALRLRVLAWQGRSDEAWLASQAVPAAAAGNPELARARADVAFWRGEYRAAVGAYDAYLAKHPGDDTARRSRALSLLELGERAEARAELDALCRRGEASACSAVRDLDRLDYALLLQAGPVLDQEGMGGWIARAGVDGQVGRRLRLGGTFDLQERRFGGGDPVRDAQFGLNAAYRLDERVLLIGGAGAAIAPKFSPDWNAHAELGLRAAGGFWFFLRYWHLEFAGGGVDVLSPALLWEGPDVSVTVRAWRGFEPHRAPSLAALAQATWSVTRPVELTVGAGAGDRADYLDLRDVAVERHVIALGGVGWNVDEAFQLRVDWLGRWERAGGDRFQRHETLFGVRRQW